MTNWTKDTDYLPNGFQLRKGAGGGDPKNGLCFMELTALMAGEPIKDEPQCACPVLTRYGIGLNDAFKDEERQRLQPLAIMMAGTRSKEYEAARLYILREAAIEIARLVLPLFESARPDDDRPRKAIEATYACLTGAGSPDAADAAYAARAADAAYAAYAAADAADAADAAPDLREKIVSMAIDALRRAIEAGPHTGVEQALAVERVMAVRDLLPVRA